jgi:hypothetical protein
VLSAGEVLLFLTIVLVLAVPSAACTAAVLFSLDRFWDMQRRRNQILVFLFVAYVIEGAWVLVWRPDLSI